MTRWTIRLLGSLRAERGSEVIVRFRTQKTASLLGYLAYRRQPQPREALIELLWPDASIEAGQQSLRTAIASLRRQFEPPGVAPGTVVIADRTSVGLNPEAVITDVVLFEEALRTAHRARNVTARAEHLAEAVRLYRGELLPGCYEDWVIPERERLSELFLQAVHTLVVLLAQAGDLKAALSYARMGVAAEPLREDLHAEVIRLLLAQGDRTAALRQFQVLRHTLKEELGAVPGPETLALISHLGDLPREAQTRAPVESAPARPTALPEQIGSGPAAQVRSGTVTLLLTDIGEAVENDDAHSPAGARAAVGQVLRSEFRRSHGCVLRDMEGAFVVAFVRPTDAVRCALACQQALAARGAATDSGDSPPGELPGVQMAIHTVEMETASLAEWSPDAVLASLDPGALAVASRLLLAAHAGQILCSEETTILVRRKPAPDLHLVHLGLYFLRGSDTAERLFQVIHPQVEGQDLVPPKAAAALATNLPAPLTRFFDREEELAHLSAELLAEETRLVTITGLSGSGKTRLAIEFARRLLEPFEGAIWYVSLVGLSDADALSERVLAAIQRHRSARVSAVDALVEAVSHQPTLLVLDNFEPMSAAASEALHTLLQRAPLLKCLVTSQRRLHVPGERELRLGPLKVPEAGAPPGEICGNPSVQLFVDRARALQPDFQVTPGNAGTLGALCRRLEGVPLALELAAARIRILPPAQMMGQMERRLDLLVSRPTPVDPRHQSLRAALGWTYRFLSPEARDLAGVLSVFRGGCDPDALEAVAGVPLRIDLLEELEEASVFQVEATPGGRRLTMLETLREYAGEQLTPDLATELRRRHADYYCRFAEGESEKLYSADEPAALDAVDTELENLRLAASWASGVGDGALTIRLSLALTRHLRRRGYLEEAGRWLELARAASRQWIHLDSALRADVRCEEANLHLDQFQWGEAGACAGEALEIRHRLGDPRGAAHAGNLLGLAARGEGRFSDAREQLQQALLTFREIDCTVGTSLVLNNLGLVEYEDPQGDTATCERYWREALQLCRESGYRRCEAEVTSNLGMLAQRRERWEEAYHHYSEALRSERELRHVFGVARALSNLGEIAEARREARRAFRLLSVATRLFERAGSPYRHYAARLLQQVEAVGRVQEERRALQQLQVGAPLGQLVSWALEV